MKKMIIYLELVAIITSFGGAIVHAETEVNDESTGLVTRTKIRSFRFSSKPPKTHRGWSLVDSRKVKNGYIGYYV